MKSTLRIIFITILMLACGSVPARADIKVRVSVTFILNNNPEQSRPAGDIGTSTGFGAEVTYGNQVLAATGSGYQISVVEYLDIKPQPPAGNTGGYWYTLLARENRETIEAAALADKATWRWNENSINIYVNNSSSGQCSFVGGGKSISFGSTVGKGTVLHEIGHLFNLRHTHTGDYGTMPNPMDGVFKEADLGDGDGLPETANDNPNVNNRDQLSQALYLKNFADTTPAQQAVVNNAFENVMSYHNENLLLPVQMDLWTMNANRARLEFCDGRTWFVANGVDDGSSGDNAGAPFGSIGRSLQSLVSPNDVVLLRSGTYTLPPGGTITSACSLRATRGPVTLNR